LHSIVSVGFSEWEPGALQIPPSQGWHPPCPCHTSPQNSAGGAQLLYCCLRPRWMNCFSCPLMTWAS
jgi:hypothetical protein